jgi:hypothetical protein
MAMKAVIMVFGTLQYRHDQIALLGEVGRLETEIGARSYLDPTIHDLINKVVRLTSRDRCMKFLANIVEKT